MKTVLNKENVPVQDRLMFLGPDLSLQRYDQFKYPKFFDLWQKQENYRWRPERIDLSKDRTDYETLTDAERFVFESNIRWQTMTDSMLSRSIHELAQYVTNPELELCMGTWASMEQIHSFSYTHIFKNITKNATRFFDSILEDEFIVKRAREISSAYDGLLGTSKDDLRENLFNAIIATQITEGISFYTSFVCSFYFGYRGLMEGSAKIIGEIARDECCVAGTEVFTQRGWVPFEDFDYHGDKVLQYNKNGTCDFVGASRIVANHYTGDIYRYHNRHNSIDFAVTPAHRVVYYDTDGYLKESEASDYPFHRERLHIPVAALKRENKLKFSIMDKLRVAVNAFGEIDGDLIKVHLKHEPRRERFQAFLVELGFPYILEGCTFFLHKLFNSIDLSWIDLEDIDTQWARSFLLELTYWHSFHHGKLKVKLSHEDNGIVQCVAAIGRAKTKYSKGVVSISEGKNSVSNKHLEQEVIPYDGMVYCLTVPSGMFFIRYNNCVSVTGNCLHMQITQQIVKNWKTRQEEGFMELLKEKEEVIYEMFKLGVQKEKEWLSYLFSQGSLIGLNEEILSLYVEWLANTRLQSMGYNKLFKANKNPISGWSNRYFDSKAVQVAPQETEVESYLIGSANTEIDYNSLSKFEL